MSFIIALQVCSGGWGSDCDSRGSFDTLQSVFVVGDCYGSCPLQGSTNESGSSSSPTRRLPVPECTVGSGGISAKQVADLCRSRTTARRLCGLKVDHCPGFSHGTARSAGPPNLGICRRLRDPWEGLRSRSWPRWPGCRWPSFRQAGDKREPCPALPCSGSGLSSARQTVAGMWATCHAARTWTSRTFV